VRARRRARTRRRAAMVLPRRRASARGYIACALPHLRTDHAGVLGQEPGGRGGDALLEGEAEVLRSLRKCRHRGGLHGLRR